MSDCDVKIKLPVKKNLVFDFECDSSKVRYSICDSGGYIKKSGPLSRNSPHNIDISELEPGTYILKIVDGDVWGNTRFEKQN